MPFICPVASYSRTFEIVGLMKAINLKNLAHGVFRVFVVIVHGVPRRCLTPRPLLSG